MPKSSKRKLEYNTKYQSSPEQVKKRVMRNQARAEAMEKGLVKKGDGKEVDHIVPLDRGGTNAASNLRVVEKGKNRAWRKGKSGYNA